MKSFIATFSAFLVALLLTGCGGSGLKVEGDVTCDGKPLENGSISFEPAQGAGRDFGGLITDGKYQVVGPPDTPAGAMTVRIRGAIKTGKKIPVGSPSPAGTMVDEVVKLPATYNDKSTLTTTLEPEKTIALMLP